MDGFITEHEVEFQKAFRGYNISEVDEYVDDLLSKKRELENNNSLLSERLASVTAEFEESKRKIGIAEKILADAQTESERILAEAEQKARQIKEEAEATAKKTTREAQTKADAIVTEAREKQARINAELETQISAKQDEYNLMCDKAEAFKKMLFEQYTSHITQLKNIEISRVQKTYNNENAEEKKESYISTKVEKEEILTPIEKEIKKEPDKIDISESIDGIVKEVQEVKIIRETTSKGTDGKIGDIRKELEAIKAEIDSRNK